MSAARAYASAPPGSMDHPPYCACKSIPAICATAGWRGVNYVGGGTAVSYAITSGHIATRSTRTLGLMVLSERP